MSGGTDGKPAKAQVWPPLGEGRSEGSPTPIDWVAAKGLDLSHHIMDIL